MAKERLHPGARWKFRVDVYIGVIVMMFIFIPFSYLVLIEGLQSQFYFAFMGIVLVVLLILSEAYARMGYDRWFYEFAKDELKLERGIIWKKYSNIPYSRIQNVDISRGIIARALGFSTIHIQTAGYSGYGRSGFVGEGYIPAVDMQKAEKIREFIIKKASGKLSGL